MEATGDLVVGQALDDETNNVQLALRDAGAPWRPVLLICPPQGAVIGAYDAAQDHPQNYRFERDFSIDLGSWRVGALRVWPACSKPSTVGEIVRRRDAALLNALRAMTVVSVVTDLNQRARFAANATRIRLA